jgi:hypothetical protein
MLSLSPRTLSPVSSITSPGVSLTLPLISDFWGRHRPNPPFSLSLPGDNNNHSLFLFFFPFPPPSDPLPLNPLLRPSVGTDAIGLATEPSFTRPYSLRHSPTRQNPLSDLLALSLPLNSLLHLLFQIGHPALLQLTHLRVLSDPSYAPLELRCASLQLPRTGANNHPSPLATAPLSNWLTLALALAAADPPPLLLLVKLGNPFPLFRPCGPCAGLSPCLCLCLCMLCVVLPLWLTFGADLRLLSYL